MLFTSMGLGLSLSRVGVSSPAGPGVATAVRADLATDGVVASEAGVLLIGDTAAGVTVMLGAAWPNVTSSMSSTSSSFMVSSFASVAKSTMVSSLVTVSSFSSSFSGSGSEGSGLPGVTVVLSPTRKLSSDTQARSRQQATAQSLLTTGSPHFMAAAYF